MLGCAETYSNILNEIIARQLPANSKDKYEILLKFDTNLVVVVVLYILWLYMDI
jgi:hypothetical protein